jgi:hypothetical protein
MTVNVRLSSKGIQDIEISADSINEHEDAHRLLGGVAGELRFLDLKLKSLPHAEAEKE